MKKSKVELRKYAIKNEGAKEVTIDGPLIVETGEHTGRSPNAKFIVKDDLVKSEIDWAYVQGMDPRVWKEIRDDFFESESYNQDLFETSVYAGHTSFRGISIKVHCELAWHSLASLNMFQEIDAQEDYDFSLYYVPSFTNEPFVLVSFEEGVIIISGTKYAGEMKKSIFTVLNHILPSENIFPMHCSINLDHNLKNPTVFFGLSGTGKTTLSADPNRALIGDDEHGWSSAGLFNFENGCYAKVINLDHKNEPEIWEACQKPATILENVILDAEGRPDFSSSAKTENTRASYPISYITNSIPEKSTKLQPKNVVLLTCDAFGVLPAVAKLTPEEAWKFFIIGYTSKIAVTEADVKEPSATFSPCFGLPFMTRKPKEYADMLRDNLKDSDINCWILNTGWMNGPYGTGERISIKDTRDILGMIYDGTLADLETFEHEYTGLNVPKALAVDLTLLKPELGWSNIKEYSRTCDALLENMKTVLRNLSI